jgi:hypothetical protein
MWPSPLDRDAGGGPQVATVAEVRAGWRCPSTSASTTAPAPVRWWSFTDTIDRSWTSLSDFEHRCCSGAMDVSQRLAC